MRLEERFVTSCSGRTKNLTSRHLRRIGISLASWTCLAISAIVSPLAGGHTVVLNFKSDGGGMGKGGIATLSVDGKALAESKFAMTIPFRISADETLDIGEDTGTPVSEDYHVPFKFTGTIGKVVILLADEKMTAADQKAMEEAEADFAVSE